MLGCEIVVCSLEIFSHRSSLRSIWCKILHSRLAIRRQKAARLLQQSKGYTIPQAAVLSSPHSYPAIPKHTPGLIKDQLSTLPLHVQVQMLFDYLHKLPGRMRGHNFLATPASLTSFNKCPIFSITIAFRHSVDDMSKSLKYSLHVHNTLQLHPVWGSVNRNGTDVCDRPLDGREGLHRDGFPFCCQRLVALSVEVMIRISSCCRPIMSFELHE